MNVKDTIKSVFVATEGSISSKRVCGVLGWIIIGGIEIYCVITGKPNPDSLPEFMFACCALLGVDSVTGIWKNRINNHGGPPADV